MAVVYNRPIFPKIKSIYAEAAVSTAANAVTVISTGIAGLGVRLQCTTGTMYVSTLSTAPTPANAYRLEEAETLDILVPEYLAYMSTSTSPQRQMIVFGV